MTTNEHAGAPTGADHSTPSNLSGSSPRCGRPEESPHYYQGRSRESVEASGTGAAWAGLLFILTLGLALAWAVVTR